MTEEEKDGIMLFRKIFQTMTLKEIDEWMRNDRINTAVTEYELEFDIIDDCNVDEYIKSNHLVTLDDLCHHIEKRKSFFDTYDRN